MRRDLTLPKSTPETEPSRPLLFAAGTDRAPPLTLELRGCQSLIHSSQTLSLPPTRRATEEVDFSLPTAPWAASLPHNPPKMPSPGEGEDLTLRSSAGNPSIQIRTLSKKCRTYHPILHIRDGVAAGCIACVVRLFFSSNYSNSRKAQISGRNYLFVCKYSRHIA